MSDLDSAYDEVYKTWNEAFPPICLRTHWDPTAVSRHTMPGVEQRDLALDPRPASMICKQYYTTSAGDAKLQTSQQFESMAVPAALRGGMQRPTTNEQQVPFPPGGAAGRGFPYGAYESRVESDLLRLKEHLTKCAEKRYIPQGGVPAPDMSMHDVPGADQRPHILANIVKESTNCRAEDDAAAWNRSSRLFFNPTRYDRTSETPATLKQAESKFALRC